MLSVLLGSISASCAESNTEEFYPKPDGGKQYPVAIGTPVSYSTIEIPIPETYPFIYYLAESTFYATGYTKLPIFLGPHIDLPQWGYIAAGNSPRVYSVYMIDEDTYWLLLTDVRGDGWSTWVPYKHEYCGGICGDLYRQDAPLFNPFLRNA